MRKLVQSAENIANIIPFQHYNLVRLDNQGEKVALLNYPDFFDTPFPSLKESWLVSLSAETYTYRTYVDSVNPPIFHRKELLLPNSDPRKSNFEALTRSAEEIGLFDKPTQIGFQKQWFALIRDKGYRLEGHALVPLGNVVSKTEREEMVSQPDPEWNVSRHLTALVRYGFSAPVQSLARYGYLDGQYDVFDYGCGRGDDVRGLLENGLIASGWDPYFSSDNQVSSADIVNLGFVVNVIEDFDERVDAIARAWSLTKRLLVVSVMLSNNNDTKGQLFRDGVLTKRGTFQKYFTQVEIKTFLEQVLDEEPIPVGPGVLYIFRDKDLEQLFLLNRYRRKTNRLRDPSQQQRTSSRKSRRDRIAEKYELNREVLDLLWSQWIELGRKPAKSEITNLVTLLEAFGSVPNALRFLIKLNGVDTIETAEVRRKEDLLVYFALNQFAKRKPYKHMEIGLQRDLKVFFGNYKQSQIEARKLLFEIADIAAIEKTCEYAAEHGFGWYIEDESLQLHTRLIENLPPLLRVYIGCASLLYGDYRSADLVKIHISSGKVSLMHYDDFTGSPLPRMLERVKVKLRDQEVDYFSYGDEFEPPFLYNKSQYFNEEFPNFPEQVEFDRILSELEGIDLLGYGPSPAELTDQLRCLRLEINGFKLEDSTTIPSLGEPCGKYLKYSQFILCGETQKETGLENFPKQVESYNALHALAVNILDEVIDYFGFIRLTYGFCSPELSRLIPGRIDIKRDQHCSHELNRLGNIISPRLGAAVDFIVEDESMLEVAQWVVENTPFDRLYYYGDSKPIHISYGPNHDKQIIKMLPGKSGKLVPRVISCDKFLEMDL